METRKITKEDYLELMDVPFPEQVVGSLAEEWMPLPHYAKGHADRMAFVGRVQIRDSGEGYFEARRTPIVKQEVILEED